MHVAEADAQPDKFGTIPEAMWWAIVTLGTVGYGDVVPVTPFGKIVASFTIIGGLMMVALPVGIIATAFAREIHRRDFVVTWSMVARVPLFAELSAAEIAHIMPLLRAQIVGPGANIVRRGEPAHSMYFIAAGEVEIELPDERVRLGGGQFFGEIAVLAPGAPLRNRDGVVAHQPADARCARFSYADGRRAAHCQARPGDGARAAWPRSRQYQRRYHRRGSRRGRSRGCAGSSG